MALGKHLKTDYEFQKLLVGEYLCWHNWSRHKKGNNCRENLLPLSRNLRDRLNCLTPSVSNDSPEDFNEASVLLPESFGLDLAPSAAPKR